jgi:hypothetical protein
MTNNNIRIAQKKMEHIDSSGFFLYFCYVSVYIVVFRIKTSLGQYMNLLGPFLAYSQPFNLVYKWLMMGVTDSSSFFGTLCIRH